uniref:QacE family quaternary ammonium compound efflux SMR transporter n=1 Tax=Thermosporothrix sp. COM3 TaxID=2490863 RepID=A0A455SH86_9CHLR|nr:QacE family quaternary ammonium compound efflux SMR transporter [Thermosporothrix sp. COM3]
MAWVALLAAGLCEVLGVLASRRVLNYRHWTSYLLVTLAFGSSFVLLSLAMTGISMGTAYAVWTGLGTCGSTILGMFAFHEPKEWRRICCISLILASAIGLKLLL